MKMLGPCRRLWYKIPKERLNISFSLSSGPGGQNVNKVSTKAEIRVLLNEADWIQPDHKERLIQQRSNSINKDGELIIQSSIYRTQSQNIEDAINKLESYLDEAAVEPKIREMREGRSEVGDKQRLRDKIRHKEKKDDRFKNKRRNPYDD
jgi:peptidyl-tRNA hydrolase ICT1